jgi:hypothetical protein
LVALVSLLSGFVTCGTSVPQLTTSPKDIERYVAHLAPQTPGQLHKAKRQHSDSLQPGVHL